MRAVLAPMLSAALLGACAAITGVSDLREEPCAAGCFEGGTPDSSQKSYPESSFDAESDAPAVFDAEPETSAVDARADAVSDARSDANVDGGAKDAGGNTDSGTADAPIDVVLEAAHDTGTGHAIQTVFIIMMSHQPWSDVLGSSDAPYINGTLLPMASHAENYYAPQGLTEGEPNFLWFEAGQDFAIADDNGPSVNHQSTTQHLVTLLNNAGISWKAYEESAPAGVCPLNDSNSYLVEHSPMVFFDDVTNVNDPSFPYCIAHVVPYGNFASDLSGGTIGRYNFIVPNICNNMHTECVDGGPDFVKSGDDWLANNLPQVLASPRYVQGGLILIAWDYSNAGYLPIGLIALSPFAKGGGYSSTTPYGHGSVVRTVEEIFSVTPLLGDAVTSTDLSDMFTTFP